MVIERSVACFQKFQNRANARPAITFIAVYWRNAKRLTAIFLRHTQQPTVTGPEPIKTFDHECALIFKIQDFGVSNRKFKLAKNCPTQIFIFDTQ